jgi:hypothetical protein
MISPIPPSAPPQLTGQIRPYFTPFLESYLQICRVASEAISLEPPSTTSASQRLFEACTATLKSGKIDLLTISLPYMVDEVGRSLLIKVWETESRATKALLTKAAFDPSSSDCLDELKRKTFGLLTLYWHDQRAKKATVQRLEVTGKVTTLKASSASNFLVETSKGNIDRETADILAQACGYLPIALDAIAKHQLLWDKVLFDRYKCRIISMSKLLHPLEFSPTVSFSAKKIYGLQCVWRVLRPHLRECEPLVEEFMSAIALLGDSSIPKGLITLWINQKLGPQSGLTADHFIDIIIAYRLACFDEHTQRVSLDNRRAKVIVDHLSDTISSKRDLTKWILTKAPKEAEKWWPKKERELVLVKVARLLPASDSPEDYLDAARVYECLGSYQRNLTADSYHKAVQTFQRALLYFRKAGDKATKTEVIVLESVLGLASVEAGHTSAGLAKLKSCADQARVLAEGEATQTLFDTLDYYGCGLGTAQKNSLASTIVEEALELLPHIVGIEDDFYQYKVWSLTQSLSTFKFKLGDQEGGISIARATLANLLEMNGQRETEGSATLRLQLANMLTSNGNYEEGLLNFDWAYEAALKVYGDTPNKLTLLILNDANNNYRSYSNPENAQKYKLLLEEMKNKMKKYSY